MAEIKQTGIKCFAASIYGLSLPTDVTRKISVKTSKNTQQAGFAAAVGSLHLNYFTRADSEIELRKQHSFISFAKQVSRGEHRGFRLWGESHPTAPYIYHYGLCRSLHIAHPIRRTTSGQPLHKHKFWQAEA